MSKAETGDDVYGEDPTINKLESYASELLNKDAAIFCPTGTQSNLMGLMSHCGRGDEYIVGSVAHTYLYEGGGAAVLGSIQPQPLPLQSNATMDLAELEATIKPKDVHFARTKLICLENTHGGRRLPDGYTEDVKTIAQRHGLGMHLDGARLFNAVVEGNSTPAALTADFDSVSICLSKGLGAPVGSLLIGSKPFIDEARHWRKMLGGGMRQSGILAAAGLFALQNNVTRLVEDHQRAALLAKELSQIEGVSIPLGKAHTNMLYVNVNEAMRKRLAELSASRNIILPQGHNMRLVTHLNIHDVAIKTIVELFKQAV
jgi:threonine aldolase